MTKSDPKLETKKPESVFTKPLTADFKALFKALAKGIGHTVAGKWEELGVDAVEVLSAIGLATEPEELAFLLIRRSMTRALFDLVGESASSSLKPIATNEESLLDNWNATLALETLRIDEKFLDRPSDIPIIRELENFLRQWLEVHGMPKPAAKAIAERFPSYFTYALNQEWRQNGKSYAPLLQALHTPFTKAGEREWAWAAYSALLQRRIQEGIFDEPFSLSQIFVPPNAYFVEESDRISVMEEARPGGRRRRFVVSLQQELEQWLSKADQNDAIRVISGGPGSGKSSFARVFAAHVSRSFKLRVLFVPLHLIDASRELPDAVGRFAKDEGVLTQNPLDPDSPEPNLLIVLDGLDELASQGKAAAETARAFIREVERTVEKRNLQSLKLRVLISGRELVVQENESEFRRARQVLTLLPYFLSEQARSESEAYFDSGKLLKRDLRHHWWTNFGKLTGKGYEGLPRVLARSDLDETTAQPLLNYLVALSFARDKLDFTKDVNINQIYGDLVAAVYERGYEKHRPYGPIRHMKQEEFARVLEEIGLAAWHGDGRTTTVREIEQHCRASGLGSLLDVFQEGAKAGVTRLLAAFFFRQYGQRASGDPTFVFTHKSFGEYLAARRIVRGIDRVIRELEARAKNPDEGWDERDALKHWAQLCGASPISRYLHVFLLNEVKLRNSSQLAGYQIRLARLFSYMLQFGLPMELLQVGPFKEVLFQARNSEEALLVALNACARVTQQLSVVTFADRTVFGAWFRRIQGQRTGPESVLAASCLSFLSLEKITLDMGDFLGANFHSSQLSRATAHYVTFVSADLADCKLKNAVFFGAQLDHCNLDRSDLEGSHFDAASLQRASLAGANLRQASLREANLRGADLTNANLTNANLMNADLRGARLSGATLEDSNLEGALLKGADIEGVRSELDLERMTKQRALTDGNDS